MILLVLYMRLLQVNEELLRFIFKRGCQPFSCPFVKCDAMPKQLLAIVLWKCGCQPFSCPCSKNVTPRPKEICWTCLSEESIPAIPFWNSKHPLPTRSLRSLRAAAHSTSSAFCLHHAHPFVAATEKNLSHAERQSFRSRSCGLQELDYRILIALSVVLCDCCKPMNNCRD